MILVFDLINSCCKKKITKLLFYYEPVQLLLVLLKFRIRLGFEIILRIPNYPEVAISIYALSNQ